MKKDQSKADRFSWFKKKRIERGRRALRRQLEYQERKAHDIGDHTETFHGIFLRCQAIRRRLERIKPIKPDDKILEVGSGAHGLIFGFGDNFGVGIDPLAVDYKRLFPKWQTSAKTVTAIGEELPFDDASFDLVLSDNVIDHAENPYKIVDEISRVLKPAGLLYFTVNVHHPIYDITSRIYAVWNAIGLRFELSAFADHTVHLTEKQVKGVFAYQPLKTIEVHSNVFATRAAQRTAKVVSPDALMKKLFFKNALVEIIAERMISGS